MVDIIAPAEAFRLLFCAHYGRQRWRTAERVAERITSYEWWRKSPWRARTTVQAVASEVLKKFTGHVKEGIRLRGILLPQNPPVEIDPADCRDGDLHVFDQALKIYERPSTFRTVRVYSKVYCVKADVLKLVDNPLTVPAVPMPARQKWRVGRPDKYDWGAYKELFSELWKVHGDFRQPKNTEPGWNSLAAVTRKMLESIKLERERPDPKVLERHIKKWIEELDRIPPSGT